MKIIVSTILILLSVCNASFSYEKLPAETLKSLKSIVPTKAALANSDKKLGNVFGRSGYKTVFTPNYCELVYSQGSEMLYAYYDHMFSVTVLSGYDYGLQAFYDYYGYFMDGTANWSYATVNGVLMMRHRYLDSKVYSDYNGQIVIFD